MAYFTTTDGINIYFEDDGDGTPLLCLAGLTRSSRDFSFLKPHMIGQRMIAMDYRGRGLSDYDSNYSNYNIVREAQDVIELLDHLELPRATILGTSRGGLIAMALAASQPDCLSGVILNDVGPVVDPSGMARILDYVGKRPRSKTLEQAAQNLSDAQRPQFPDVPPSVWRKQAEFQFRAVPEGLELRYDEDLRTALQEQAASGATPDLWPLFEALHGIPTGVIRGANSDILSSETLSEMQARHPDMISAEIPNRGHVPFLDEPQSLDIIHRVLEAA